jgi:outer membrane biosynthesis protein TonB
MQEHLTLDLNLFNTVVDLLTSKKMVPAVFLPHAERKVMRRLIYLVALSWIALVLYAPAALAQDLDCADFATQEEAQQQLLPGDPYRLDADSDGIACEELLSGGQQQPSPQPQPSPSPQPSASPQPQPSPSPQPQPSPSPQPKEMVKELPATGGGTVAPSLLLTTAVLVGAGILVLAVNRRNR